MHLNLPPGYYLVRDADITILRDEAGRSVAFFSARGVVGEAVEVVAWEDHHERKRPSLATSRRTETAPEP
jgi:hypothetical protein